METLHDLFEDTLKDVYYAENAILTALPKMMKAASAKALQAAFAGHLEETKAQIKRLDEVFDILDVKPAAKECHAIKGLIAEGEELIAEKPEAAVLDAALLATAQAVEHYEMARYGTLRAWADQLGLSNAAMLLQQTLAEEKATDAKLSVLALGGVNMQADDGEHPAATQHRPAGAAGHDKDADATRKSGAPRQKSAAAGR